MADQTISERLLDKRVVQRYVAEGKLKKEQVQAHTESLKDLSSECEDMSDAVEKILEAYAVPFKTSTKETV